MFLRGIHPHYAEFFENELKLLLGGIIDLFVDKLMDLESEEMEQIKAQLDPIKQEFLKTFYERELRYRKNNHISPILSIVGKLPRNELAAMAESLINLTSFKRKMSVDAETVGGPIDVAVISKMDGFIWVKRKRYFDLDLTP